METPIKSRIISRILELLQPLIAQGKTRNVERVHAIFLEAAIKPAIHVVVGDEGVINQDNRGYTKEFPVAFEFIFDELRDPEGKADQLAAYLQEVLESDPQLSSLCNAITYDGCQPYIPDTAKPTAVTVCAYVVQYRRERARPDVNY